MKTISALSLMLAFGMPVLAQEAPAATYDEQQACLTWLSLASRFAVEGQQEAFERQHMRLNAAMAERSDLSQEQKLAAADAATGSYDQWVLDHFNGNETTKTTMLAEVLDKAAACEALVPVDPDDEIAPIQ
jgi:hypothetical protein